MFRWVTFYCISQDQILSPHFLHLWFIEMSVVAQRENSTPVLRQLASSDIFICIHVYFSQVGVPCGWFYIVAFTVLFFLASFSAYGTCISVLGFIWCSFFYPAWAFKVSLAKLSLNRSCMSTSLYASKKVWTALYLWISVCRINYTDKLWIFSFACIPPDVGPISGSGTPRSCMVQIETTWRGRS